MSNFFRAAASTGSFAVHGTLLQPLPQLLLILLLSFSLFNCKPSFTETDYKWNIPEGLDTPVHPKENKVTVEKIKLGRKLFFDPILSEDSTISCSSCHLPEKAYTDGLQKSLGFHGTTSFRNSPTLVNVAYYPYFFSEGQVLDLETQVQAPGITSEMGTNMHIVIKRIRNNSEYKKLFYKAFGVDTPDLKHIVYAIASFERTLISANSKWDKYLRTNDSTIFSKQEWLGKVLFFSDRTNCSKCHEGVLLTNFKFENIGLEEWYTDPGKWRATGVPSDSGKFKNPTLRNVAYTPPYMHDGRFSSLIDVIEFYNSGGSNKYKSAMIKPLKLSEEEKNALVSFLNCFTDEDLILKKGIYTP